MGIFDFWKKKDEASGEVGAGSPLAAVADARNDEMAAEEVVAEPSGEAEHGDVMGDAPSASDATAVGPGEVA